MYTVGWGGEILRTDGRRWQHVHSPVSAALRAACVAPDGMVYAVGYDGTMVRGRGDSWSVIETGRKGVFLDVCSFRSDVFVATSLDVLKLGPSGLEPVTDFDDPEDRPTGCVGLCAAADGSGVFGLAAPTSSGSRTRSGTAWPSVGVRRIGPSPRRGSISLRSVKPRAAATAARPSISGRLLRLHVAVGLLDKGAKRDVVDGATGT